MSPLALPRCFRIHASLAWLVVAGASSAFACNVPVFRYALENWPPDPYRITIVHDENWTPTIESDWRSRLAEQARSGNFQVEIRDCSALDSDERKLLLPGGDEPLPRLILRYPSRLNHASPIWSSELTSRVVRQAVSSPAREAMINRLAAGETAVWVLVESGDSARDDDLQTRLDSLLNTMAGLLSLPALSPTDPADDLRSEVPLKLAFSILRVAKTADEEPFLRMLLEGGEAYDEPGPVVFPVFGRGRVLCAFHGDAITSETLLEAANFIVGACSCQVKERNPGFDILLNADWDRLLSIRSSEASPRGSAPESSAEPEYVALPPGSRHKPEAASLSAAQGEPPRLLRTVLAVAAALGILAAVVGLAWRR